jgi:hypothetical protein
MDNLSANKPPAIRRWAQRENAELCFTPANASWASSADRLEVLPRLPVPVATTSHLIALKVLAGRSQDLADLGYLIPSASPAELDAAREAVKRIQVRGFSRGQDVAADLETFIADASR